MDNEPLFDALRNKGCDIDGAIYRLIGNKELYIKLLVDYTSRFPIDQLKEYIDKSDAVGAFEIAHSMKGALGNLGLSPMYLYSGQICDKLRNGVFCDISSEFDKLKASYSELHAIIENNTVKA